MDELRNLLSQAHDDCEDWVLGKIPKHFKRLTVDMETAKRLAVLGQTKLGTYFGEDDKPLRLYFCQALIAGAVFSGDYDNITVCTPSQYGKLIADDCPVLTRNGWKNHGDLTVGDEVLSPSGEFVKVVYVHPKQHTDRIVEFSNGEKIECHHNHEWVVYDHSRKRIMETDYIKKFTDSDKDFRLGLPFVEPVIGEHKDLSVPPYMMGVWLGDGATNKGQICASPKDIAVLDALEWKHSTEWVHKDTGVITRQYKGLLQALRIYGLCESDARHNKRIPVEYLTADIEQRLQLLAGLIDTDGYTHTNKRGTSRTYFTTADESLKDSFESFIATFGWRTSTVRIEPRLSSSGIQGRRPYYVIGFQPTLQIPCVLERKRIKKFGKQRRIGIKSVTECEPHQGNCITVEGGVYLVGRKLVPTHNSFIFGRTALGLAYEGNQVYTAAATTKITEVLMDQTVRAVSESHPEIQAALAKSNKTSIERLTTALSRYKIGFPPEGKKLGGFVESITFGDTFSDKSKSGAVGRTGIMFIDEAALCSEEALAETGRRQFAKIDGTAYPRIMISNPHRVGVFYDYLTGEAGERDFVLWIDALTAMEEERFNFNQIVNSDNAKHRPLMKCYLLCELDEDGLDQFAEPVIVSDEEPDDVTYYLGVDAAYKGKDSICLCLGSVGDKVRVEDIVNINVVGDQWIDGVTSKKIIDDISRLVGAYRIQRVCVDIGYGVWLKEGLAQRGIAVEGINFGGGATKELAKAGVYAAKMGANKRAEMHLHLQSLMDDRTIGWTPKAWEKVRDIMPHIKMEMKTSGKIQVVPKNAIKAVIGRSPDELDACLLMIQAVMTDGFTHREYIT